MAQLYGSVVYNILAWHKVIILNGFADNQTQEGKQTDGSTTSLAELGCSGSCWKRRGEGAGEGSDEAVETDGRVDRRQTALQADFG